MELHSATTRFALACNNSTKIIEPIQSRCAILRYSRLSDVQVTKRLLEVSRPVSEVARISLSALGWFPPHTACLIADCDCNSRDAAVPSRWAPCHAPSLASLLTAILIASSVSAIWSSRAGVRC